MEGRKDGGKEGKREGRREGGKARDREPRAAKSSVTACSGLRRSAASGRWRVLRSLIMP